MVSGFFIEAVYFSPAFESTGEKAPVHNACRLHVASSVCNLHSADVIPRCVVARCGAQFLVNRVKIGIGRHRHRMTRRARGEGRFVRVTSEVRLLSCRKMGRWDMPHEKKQGRRRRRGAYFLVQGRGRRDKSGTALHGRQKDSTTYKSKRWHCSSLEPPPE